jgi:hypothetical protein
VAAYANRPDFAFQIAFNAGPNDAVTAPIWNNFTKYVRSMSALSRGIQYELGTALAASPAVLLRDVDEYLNSANTGSPYYPNIKPYRRVLFQGVWPNAGTGNLINANTWRGNSLSAYDGTFDSYSLGFSPWWMNRFGAGCTDVISAGTTHSGANCLLVTMTLTTAFQGAYFIVPAIPGRQYTASAYVRLTSANTIAIGITGGATGTSTSTVGSYVRLTVTFTATQPSHQVQVFTTGTVAAGSFRIDDLQFEAGASASAFTTTGAVIYPIMAPYAERFVKNYKDGAFTGYCSIPCVDALAALSNISIATDYISGLTLQYTPDHYWPLSGGSVTTAWLPGTSNKPTPPLSVITSKNGLGTGQAPVPGSNLGILGDPGGTGVLFSPPATITQKGAILGSSTGSLSFPGVTGATGYSATMSAWVVATARPSEVQAVMFAVASSPNTTQPLLLGISVTNQIYASVGGTLDFAFSPLFFATNGPVITDGKPHLLFMTVVQDVTNTVLRAYVDGAQIGTGLIASTASIGGVLTATTTGKSMQIGGFFAYTAYEDQLQGAAAHAAAWDRALGAGEIADLWLAGNGYAGNTTSGGVVGQHILTYGKYAGTTRISPGSTVMGAPTNTGTIDLLSDTNRIVDAELGRVWAAPDGAVVFEGRQDRYLRLTSSATLGQNVAGGHIPFDESVELDTDPQYVYVNVQYTQGNGPTAVGGTPADVATAALDFFYPGFSKTVDTLTAATAQTLADWVFYTHNGAVQRVASITLDPASNPTLWAFCLSVEIGWRLTFSLRAPAANNGAGITSVNDFFVESVSHDGIDADAGTWFTTLWMSPLALGTPQSGQPGILDDTTWGILDSTAKLAP